jgi:hypothetical protein
VFRQSPPDWRLLKLWEWLASDMRETDSLKSPAKHGIEDKKKTDAPLPFLRKQRIKPTSSRLQADCKPGLIDLQSTFNQHSVSFRKTS